MGHMDVVTYLLQRGSDPNATTVRGETSLHLATRGNQIAIMKVLLRTGALVDAKAKVCTNCYTLLKYTCVVIDNCMVTFGSIEQINGRQVLCSFIGSVSGLKFS